MLKTDPLIFFPEMCSSHADSPISRYGNFILCWSRPKSLESYMISLSATYPIQSPNGSSQLCFQNIPRISSLPTHPHCYYSSWSAQHLLSGLWQWPHKWCVSFYLLKFLLVCSLIVAANMTLLTYYSTSWPLLCPSSPRGSHITLRKDQSSNNGLQGLV